MKTNYIKSVLTAIALMLSLSANAYDFCVDGIYYITSNSSPYEVGVTYFTSAGGSYFGEIVIPSSVTYKNVTYSVKSIGYEAFDYCSGLTSVTIPNSVTSIGKKAFSNCTGLTSVIIGNSVTNIEESAFMKCSNVKKLIYAEGTTKVLETGLTSITSVTIPNSVTSIGNIAFSSCTGLTSVTIGNSVTSIGERAFYRCSGLESVYVCWDEPIRDVEAQDFDGAYKSTLYVPIGTTSKYKSADVWKTFYKIKEWDASVGIENIAKDSQLQPTMNGSIIDFSGQRVTNPVKGQMYIINGKKVYYR